MQQLNSPQGLHVMAPVAIPTFGILFLLLVFVAGALVLLATKGGIDYRRLLKWAAGALVVIVPVLVLFGWTVARTADPRPGAPVSISRPVFPASDPAISPPVGHPASGMLRPGPEQGIAGLPPRFASPPGIAVVGLLALATFLVTSVLLTSKQGLAMLANVGSMLGVLVWVAPAIAVVYLVGFSSIRSGVIGPVDASHSSLIVEHSNRSDDHGHDSHGHEDHGGSDSHAAPITSKIETVSASGLVSSSGTGTLAEAIPARLVVRSISTDQPAWTKGVQTADGRELECISSQRFATLIEAEQQITSEALSRVRAHYVNQELSQPGIWQAPVEIIDRYAVKNLVGEVMDKDFGNGFKDKMYRAHLQLDFSPQLHDALQRSWRERTAQQRLMGLAGVLGLVTVMLGTAAGYFRLDDATAGQYRGRLKLAAAAVIAAGGLLVVSIA